MRWRSYCVLEDGPLDQNYGLNFHSIQLRWLLESVSFIFDTIGTSLASRISGFLHGDKLLYNDTRLY